jgi:transcriptional regulator with XRE-family HTH domain
MQAIMITAEQLRAARSALGWSVVELSARSGVGTATIKRYEAVQGLPKSRKDNLGHLKLAFESAGIEFIGTPDDAPGIRIHPRSPET